MSTKLIVISALLCAAASTASAVTFSGTASGSWSNADANFGFSISNGDLGGTADVNWGIPGTTTFDNLWSFNGVGSDGGAGWSADDGDIFSFGDFSYRNGSVNGHDFSGADLDVTLDILAPLGLSQTFDFEFDVVNVPNTSGDPVIDGDIADITGGVSSQSFTFAGDAYTLELIGFSQDGGLTVTNQFNSPEGAIAVAELYGRINLVPPSPVPLPAAGWMLLAGVGGLGALRRRKKLT